MGRTRGGGKTDSGLINININNNNNNNNSPPMTGGGYNMCRCRGRRISGAGMRGCRQAVEAVSMREGRGEWESGRGPHQGGGGDMHIKVRGAGRQTAARGLHGCAPDTDPDVSLV